MRYIITGTDAKKADRDTIERIGMPSMVLMERAALKCVQVLKEEAADLSRVLVVCGTGNNGGDGFAIARLLYLEGIDVTVYFDGKEDRCTEETRHQMRILKNYGVPVGNTIGELEYSVIIDAVFGIGLNREIEGGKAELIEKLNAMSGFKLAVDIPSGIDAETGAVLGIAFSADVTVSFACEKMGTLLYPGYVYAGKVRTADIGISRSFIAGMPEAAVAYEPDDVKRLMPARRPNSHKGTYGKLLMVAGSEGMSGAAYLSAKAAYETGAGLVRIYTKESNRQILQTLLPEAVVSVYDKADRTQLNELLTWADTVAVGSGLGMSETSKDIVRYICRDIQKPCIIDADALNLMAEFKDREEILKEKGDLFTLTPHMKEFSRFIHTDLDTIKKDRRKILKQLEDRYGCVWVSKDARTLVGQKEKPLFIGTSGNSAMAKAGSGDVLTGIIAGLTVQGMPLYDAACLGVYLHGLSGDYARQKKGPYSVLAGDLTDGIGQVLRE